MQKLHDLLLTRRAALHGFALVGALAFSNATSSPTPTPTPEGTPEPAAPPTEPPVEVLTLDELISTKTFDAEWTMESIVSFPRVIRIAPRSGPVQVTLRWDPRLFEVQPTTFGLASEAVSFVEDVTYEASSLTATVPAGISEIYVDARALNLYPLENIGPVESTVATILDSAGVELGSVALSPSESPCVAWGAVIDAEWVTRKSVILPSLVTLTSPGPRAIPVGMVFEISAADLRLEDIRVTDGITVSSVDGGTAIATLTRPLEPGELADIAFSVVPDDSSPQRSPKYVARAALRLPESTTGMRVTGLDAAYPLTPSGSPVSSFEEALTA